MMLDESLLLRDDCWSSGELSLEGVLLGMVPTNLEHLVKRHDMVGVCFLSQAMFLLIDRKQGVALPSNSRRIRTRCDTQSLGPLA